MIQNPLNLGSAEIWIQPQSSPLLNLPLPAIPFQAPAAFRRPAVLPDDGMVYRLPGLRIPQHGSFTLIGNTYPCDRAPLKLSYYFLKSLSLGCPDFLRVVLHPSWLGIILGKLPLGRADNPALLVEKQTTRTRGSLIQSEDKLHSLFRGSHLESLFKRSSRETGSVLFRYHPLRPLRILQRVTQFPSPREAPKI